MTPCVHRCGARKEAELALVTLSGRVLRGPLIPQREGNVFLGISDQNDEESRANTLKVNAEEEHQEYQDRGEVDCVVS